MPANYIPSTTVVSPEDLDFVMEENSELAGELVLKQHVKSTMIARKLFFF